MPAGRLNGQEFALRHLSARDADFRMLCDDYETALCAWQRWRTDSTKEREYRELAAEIENEIVEIVSDYLRGSRR